MKKWLILWLAVVPSFAGVDYKNVKLLKVTDGDTITVDLPCGEPLFCMAMPVRLKGVDTPELRGKCEAEKEQASAAKAYLTRLLAGKSIGLIDCERGKYFRIACKVYVNEQDVAFLLIKQGLGRPYDGKSKKESWCY